VSSPRSPAAVDATLVRRYTGEYATHRHEHAQVLLGLQGGLDLDVDGHAAFVDASCGLVVPAGARHAYMATGTARVVVLDCDSAPATGRLRRFALPAGWLQRQAPGLDAAALLAALALLPGVPPRRRIDLDALAAGVDADLARGWTVAELAALCHLSPQRLRARFAALAGTSPLAWVRQRRLDAAQRLLGQGWPLDTVALHVGYAGASALSHALRRDRGTGARALRRPEGRALLES
jgi:AraC-like DNA-binding protein